MVPTQEPGLDLVPVQEDVEAEAVDADEARELLEDLEYALDQGPLYPEEVELYGAQRRELLEYLARLVMPKHLCGAVDQTADEWTLNDVAIAGEHTMAESKRQFVGGEIVARRWVRVGVTEYPRVAVDQ